MDGRGLIPHTLSMKHIVIFTLLAMLCLNMIAQERIKLTHHTKASKMTLLEALQNRHSVREYASKEISNETLGTLL